MKKCACGLKIPDINKRAVDGQFKKDFITFGPVMDFESIWAPISFGQMSLNY